MPVSAILLILSSNNGIIEKMITGNKIKMEYN